MKQFNTNITKKEEKYSLVFTKEPVIKSFAKSGKTFMLVCTVKKIKHA